MAPERKRAAQEDHRSRSVKRQRSTDSLSLYEYPILWRYYSRVSSLRSYLLSQFPQSSRARKRRLKNIPLWSSEQTRQSTENHLTNFFTSPSNQPLCETPELSKLLDGIIVGHTDKTPDLPRCLPLRDIESLSQKLRSTVGSSAVNESVTQSDASALTLES